MADIFGYNRTGASDVFVADKSTLSIAGVRGVDLIQNWNIQYQQSIQPIYELGSSRMFWAKSNPIGTGTIARIVGSSFLNMSSGLCDTGKTIQIANSGGSCSGGGGVKLSCTGAVCTSVGFSAQAGTPTVAQNLTFQFSCLSVD